MNPTARLRAYGLDAVLVALLVWGVADGIANPTGYEGDDKGPTWLVVGLPVVLNGLLLARRRAPFGAAALVLVLAGCAALVEPNAVVDNGGNVFTIGIAAFLLGAAELREALVALPLIAAAVVLVNALDDEVGWGDYFFPLLFFLIAWGFGVLNAARERSMARALWQAEGAERAREQATADAVEAERQRIARELHDVVAHSVSVMTVQAGAVRRLLLPEQERERQALEAVEQTGREALAELRRLVGLLREEGAGPELAPQPGLETLPSLIGSVRESGLAVNLAVEGAPRDVPAGVDLAAYRIVQEALTSALEHGRPRHAWVSLRWRKDELELEVANDARQDPLANGAGRSLAALRERVATVGGELETGLRAGGGYVVRALLPLREDA